MRRTQDEPAPLAARLKMKQTLALLVFAAVMVTFWRWQSRGDVIEAEVETGSDTTTD